MKMFRLSAYTLIASILASSSAFAATASGTSNARVITPIAVSAGAALEFGSFSVSGSSGTITQAGVVTGGVTAVSGGATRAAGTFNVTGESSTNTAYTFNLPSSATLTRSGGSETMTADLSYASGTSARSLTSGSDTVTVNGSLNVAVSQASGSYTGTYIVSAIY